MKERYAKDMYFKTYANPDLFITERADPITAEIVHMLKSSSDLKVGEMSNAINNFRHWAEDNGYCLPEASENEDGTMQFNSEKDRQAFEKAKIETERASQYIN